MAGTATVEQEDREDFEDVYEEARVGVRALYGLWDLCTEAPDRRTGKGWMNVFCITRVLHTYMDERVDRLRTLHREEVEAAQEPKAAD